MKSCLNTSWTSTALPRRSKAELKAAAEKVLLEGRLQVDWTQLQAEDFWFFATLAEKNPNFLLPYLPQIWAHLDRHDPGALRCGLSVFRKVKIPASLEGEVYGFCMNVLTEGRAPVAVLSFALWICANISLPHADLRKETIERANYYRDRRAEPALQSATKNVLIKLTPR
jgi:hypothetical protein